MPRWGSDCGRKAHTPFAPSRCLGRLGIVADMPHALTKINKGTSRHKKERQAGRTSNQEKSGVQGAMRVWQSACFAAAFVAFAESPFCVAVVAKIPADRSNLVAEEDIILNNDRP